MTTAAARTSQPDVRSQPSDRDRRRRCLGPAAGARLVKFLVFGRSVSSSSSISGREIVETLFKIVVAVGIVDGFFVGANKLFDLTYDRWTLFGTIAGFAVGFVTFAVLDGNHVLRDLPPRPWVWASDRRRGRRCRDVRPHRAATRRREPGCPSPSADSPGSACSCVWPSTESQQPSLDWAKLLVCTAIGVGRGRRCPVARRPPRAATSAFRRAALLGAHSAGWSAPGAAPSWDPAERPARHSSRPSSRSPSSASLSACQPSRRRRSGARSSSGRGPGSSPTPALVFIAGGLLIPLVRTVIQSLENQRQQRVRRHRQLPDRDHEPHLLHGGRTGPGTTSSAVDCSGSPAVVTVIGLVIGLINGRVVRRPFEATPGSVIVLLVAFFFAACLVLSHVAGLDRQQHVVGRRRHDPVHGVRAGRGGARRPGQAARTSPSR